MSGEGFLGRWARLKGGARPAEPQEAAPAAAVPAVREDEAEIAAKIAKLPRIEDLNPFSDFRQFLQDWVPQPLQQAALRRLWLIDPAIRNFEGPARDYGFNYNIPGDAPGYGAIGPWDDVSGQIARLFRDAAPPEPPQPLTTPASTSEAEQEPAVEEPETSGDSNVALHNGGAIESARPMPEVTATEAVSEPVKRRHGSAIPS
jgi:hypothetical protein